MRVFLIALVLFRLALAWVAVLLVSLAAPGAAVAGAEDEPEQTAFQLRLPPGRVTAPHIHKQLEGLFEVVQTVPAIGMDEKEYDREYFFPGQKVRFKYRYDMEEGDGVWAGEHAYQMTLEPPLPMAMCRHQRWHYLCQNDRTYLPQQPEEREMVLAVYELAGDEPQRLSPLLKPLGLMLGKYSYGLAFLDKTGAFMMYFHDRDTLINRTWHRHDDGPGGKDRIVDVIQVLKRVK